MMSTDFIVSLIKGELKCTEDLLDKLNGQKEFNDLRLQTEGKYIALKQLLEVIEA